jgi:hypothetical protein
MTNEKYGLMKAEERPEILPKIDLMTVHHCHENLIVARFGPNTYANNIINMRKRYFNSKQHQDISFRPATTSESISAAAYKFRDIAKPEIFDTKWLQAGYISKTPNGMFVNPPLDLQGKPIIDEQKLWRLLNGAELIHLDLDNFREHHVIYILDNSEKLKDFGFAEYGAFLKEWIQDTYYFENGGLAKLLEHTKYAKNLAKICDAKSYPKGIDVIGFNPVKSPILMVVKLGSIYPLDDSKLGVCCDLDNNDGFAFGVLEEKIN